MEPATLQRVDMPTREFYDLMVEAHLQAVLVLEHHRKEFHRWNDDGRPTREGPHGNLPAHGYGVLNWGSQLDIERYLRELMGRIRFVDLSLNADISVTWDEFERYGLPNYKLKG